MKSFVVSILSVVLVSAAPVHAGVLDDITKGEGLSSKGSADAGTVAAGLKEALTIGTENAVLSVSQVNGYFGK